MILTTKQEEGLRISIQRFRNREPYTCISGYAGTGKSTLVQFIISALNLSPDDVAYCAFTGKAACVLAQKGCPNATTAHKLLYYAKLGKDGKYYFTPRPSLDGDYRLIVVDEISMLPKAMWDLLLTHHVHVIALGDPFQLPPVVASTDNHVLDKPHVFLDQIMRQALDSEIIRFSMWIREGKPISMYPAENKEVMCLHPEDVSGDVMLWADQMLCATNDKRHELNAQMRELLGHGPEPQVGDKVIGLNNHWDFMSSTNTPLINGTIGTITNLQKETVRYPSHIFDKPVPVLYACMETEMDGNFYGVPMDYTCLTTGKSLIDGATEYKISKLKNCPAPPWAFAYAYCTTTHKYQGSQADNVLVFEERFPFKWEEHARWAYTAVTRSAKRCVFVYKN